MIQALALILALQWTGEVVARIFHIPVPGPVLGMIVLLVGLVLRARRGPPEEVPESLDAVSGTLLRHLSLLFVPAGVGVIVHLQRLYKYAIPLGAAVILGTAVAFAVTGVVTQMSLRGEDA